MACGITDYQSDCIIFCLFTVQCIATKIAYKDCLRYTSRAHRTHTHICTNPCKSSPSSHGDAELALTGFLQKTGQMVHTKLRCIQTPLSNSSLRTAPRERSPRRRGKASVPGAPVSPRQRVRTKRTASGRRRYELGGKRGRGGTRCLQYTHPHPGRVDQITCE